MPGGIEENVDGAAGRVPTEEEISWHKKRRTQMRKQITTSGNQIDVLIANRGSRGAIKGIIDHLRQLQRDLTYLHTDIMSVEQVAAESERQEETHLRYTQQVGESIDKAEQYLESRMGDAASSVLGANPNADASLAAQRRTEEYAAAQRRAGEARLQVEEAERALNAFSIADEDHHSSVSHQGPIAPPNPRVPIPQLPPGIPGRRIPYSSLAAPDDWIDHYSRGSLLPVTHPHGTRSSISADLEVYHGKALDWFPWIDVFKALVHDTPKSAGEKLALLKRYVRGDCQDIIYGLGGGEPAYIEALVRLKQTCGRRDVMRAAHVQAMDKLELKQDPRSFKRFAERIRTHLFDLTRIGETSTVDLIERICQRLSLHDRLAWNEGRWGQIEHRSLNDFGTWLCQRASSYQNAYTLAADQVESTTKEKSSDFNRRARTHQGSTTPRKPFCFKCGKDHRLYECDEFKELSIGERVTFCIRHHLCFCCFGTKHSVVDCPAKKPCEHEDCRYTHHELLHDPDRLPVRRSRPSAACSGRPGVDLGMMRLEVTSTDGRHSVRVNAFVDEGSDSTLMVSSCASVLGLQGDSQILEVDGVGGEVRQHTSKRVQFVLRSESGESFTMEASTMKKVANPAPVVDWSEKKLTWPHLADLPVGEVGGSVDLLIGMDYAHLLVVQESRGGKAGEPIASRTRLGWIIRGVTDTQDARSSARSCRIIGDIPLDDLKMESRRFCDTEDLGTEFRSKCLTPDHECSLELGKEDIRKVNVGYEVPAVWQEDEPKLSNNQDVAMNRWKNPQRQFARRPEFEKDYRAVMGSAFEQGYASILRHLSNDLCFLAHHGVYKGKKLQVVMFSAVSFQGKCPNDALLTNTALQPSSATVVTPFRAYEAAWASDVKAKFSRFRLASGDANYCCFLWGDKGIAVPDVCRMDRLPFGASCSLFVAIYPVRRIMEDAGASETIVSLVRISMYVNDYIHSAPSVDEEVAEATDIRDHLLAADSKLQCRTTDSTEFVQKMGGGHGASPHSLSAHPLVPDPERKVLGVAWDVRADTLGFKVTERPVGGFTRVALIIRVTNAFDPLCPAALITVKAKIKLRELSMKGPQWADFVAGDDQRRCGRQFDALQLLSRLETSQCLFPGEINPANAVTRSALEGDVFPSAWLAGPDFRLSPGAEWPVDLPWMAVEEESRPARILNVTQVPRTDWSKVKVTSEEVPLLCSPNEKFPYHVRRCQAESSAEELRCLQKKRNLHFTSSLLALAPILGEDGLLRLGRRAGRARLLDLQLHPSFLPDRHFGERQNT